MTTSNLNIRIDDSLKNQAKVILDGYGISPSQAVKMLFLELVATRKFPLNLSYQAEYEPKPTAKLLRAIKELEQDDLPTYSSIDELLGAMNEKV